jgi:ribosomal protein L7/L12
MPIEKPKSFFVNVIGSEMNPRLLVGFTTQNISVLIRFLATWARDRKARSGSPHASGACRSFARGARLRTELGSSGGLTMERKGKKPKGKAAGGDRYDVMLTGGGDRRLAVAKIFNEISSMRRIGAELQEIFSRPTPIKEGVTKDEAAQIKRRIEDAGGSVKITPARG